MSEEIKLYDVKFPSNFKFEKTFNGFKVNTTGGEFFPNKNKGIISFLIFLCILFSILTPWYFAEKNNATFAIVSIFCWLILIPIFMIIQNLTNRKAEYIFSPNGINIISQKETISIPKTNINNIYTKILRSDNGENSYSYYSIFIEFKEPIHISYKNQNKETINLFLDTHFKEEKTAFFLIQELDKILDINDVENYFEEIEKQIIDDSEIQLPKNLNYQKNANGFTISSDGGIFFPNKYAITIIIITIIVFFTSFSHFGSVQNYIMNLPNISILIKILILMVIFFGSFITIFGSCYIFLKNTVPKADYIFSSNGITIMSKDGVFNISADDIESIYLEKRMYTYSEETSTSHSIHIDFKVPIYIKSIKANIQTTTLLENLPDSKVCTFLVQKMKNALNLQSL